MENQQALFKTAAIGGFDKKSVLTYIYEEGDKARAVQEELTQRLEEVTQAREGLEKEINNFKRRIETLESSLDSTSMELEDEKHRSGELAQMLDKVNTEMKRQKVVIAKKDQEIESQILRICELEEKSQRLERESANVEKASLQIGTLLVEAKTTAEKTIASAQQQADEIVEAARGEASDIVEEANKSVVTIYESLNTLRGDIQQIKDMVARTVASVNDRVDAISDFVDQTEQKLRESCEVATPEEATELAYEEAEAASEESFFQGTAEQ